MLLAARQGAKRCPSTFCHSTRRDSESRSGKSGGFFIPQLIELHEAHMRSIREVCARDHSAEEIAAWGGRPYVEGQRVSAIKNNFVWVIEENEKIEGYGLLTIKNQNGKQHAYIGGLYLTPSVNGKGLGSEMISLMLAEARAADVEVVHLESTITAHKFHKKMGFVDTGEQILTQINGVGIRSYPMEYKFSDSFDEVIALEKKLLEPGIRSNAADLDQLLDHSFVEFGSSGKRYRKSDTLNLLPSERPTPIEAFEFEPIWLAPNLIQLRFKTRRMNSDASVSISLRSSIWKKYDVGWKLIFHQGTPAAF